MNSHRVPSLLLVSALALAITACDDGAHEADDGHAHEIAAETTDDDHGEGHGDDDGHGHDESEADATTIPAETAARSGIVVAAVSAGDIQQTVRLPGVIEARQGAMARVAARFPGAIRDVAVQVGDRVRAGQRLATVESNASLSTYAITTPLAGVVMTRDAEIGGLAGESPLFEVADLSKVWIDLHVFGRDAQRVRVGAEVRVERLADGVVATANIGQVLPATDVESQSLTARAVLDNADGLWRPGMAVHADVTIGTTEAALRVPLDALQRMEGRDVVFVREGDTYTATPVRLGVRDATFVQISDGVNPGDEVVVEQSFLVKADIAKAGAAHEH
ncbi:efflux RND transporter periplasmic adaptor subunit [Silanimonas sp.]|jgi:cobalt-zinc-cadmium efflux system membrane fusion protein|uniref:efflux RND transporter periplasmic adaptor subunit n=1 Tax=Silanimonas sp. TaxID=1929290 RepID=UPI0022BFA5A1|nr:efflux RND transporter periplasmic adaptor subunit [Silanimonas sp.]MCZ8062800.1 efflux RND transporter periplasmic adaptor subunit [Silanimonas sp.]